MSEMQAEPGLTRVDHPVGKTGNSLTVFTLTGARPGPVLATIGAVHGDEYEGPVVLSRLLASIQPAELAGTWIVAPAANRDAMAGASRCSVSDGLNLARVFPGDVDGAPTEQIAALILAHVIRPAQVVIDLHSGGNALASAFFAGYSDGPGVGARARALAEAFGAPWIWRHDPPHPGGRTMSACYELGLPGIYVEATGGSFPPEETLVAYEAGMRRALAHLGMLDGAPAAPAAPRHVHGDGNLDVTGPSPATGICSAHVAPMQRVSVGDALFTITDLDGAVLAEVTAQAPGRVMFVRRNRWVEAGETLIAVAQDEV